MATENGSTDTAAVAFPESSQCNSSPTRRSSSMSVSEGNGLSSRPSKGSSLGGIARHTLGLTLLLATVVLWTASSFLSSTIFADNTYSKPFFLIYFNSWVFSVLLIFEYIRSLNTNGWSMWAFVSRKEVPRVRDETEAFIKPVEDNLARTRLSLAGTRLAGERNVSFELSRTDVRDAIEEVISVRETAKLSFQFSVIWFAANYFSSACLEYTTVASTTILSSTSSIWTLIFGVFLGVEGFSLQKLLGVLASFVGILLVSGADISGDHDKNRGTFPHKSSGQIAVGDALALLGALLYGIYATVMKKKLGDESRVNMLLFFGMVGLFNAITLFPVFPILHFTGIESFQPPTKRVFMIIAVNSIISLVSDICWAYAMLLTSPLVVTVGLSLTIPLSLVGQIILNSQTSSLAYWLGALVVLLSFIFINYQSQKEEETPNHESGNGLHMIDDDVT